MKYVVVALIKVPGEQCYLIFVGRIFGVSKLKFFTAGKPAFGRFKGLDRRCCLFELPVNDKGVLNGVLDQGSRTTSEKAGAQSSNCKEHCSYASVNHQKLSLALQVRRKPNADGMTC